MVTQSRKLNVFTFKPGDVISKFYDDSRPVIVDDIVDCARFSDDIDGQTESMYVVNEYGMGGHFRRPSQLPSADN